MTHGDDYTPNPLATRAVLETMQPDALVARQHQFVRLIPERVQILEAAVRSTSGFADWIADWSPRSMGRPYEWLAHSVTTRERRDAEAAVIAQSLKLPVPISHVDLSDETLSFCYDISMYFGAALFKHNHHLQWAIILDDRLNMEYGQPVVIGFPNDVPLNPVRIVTNMAYSIVRGTAKPGRLEELFGVWSERAARSSGVH